MARKRRPAPAPSRATPSGAPAAAPAATPAATPAPAVKAAAPVRLPSEPADDGWAGALLALMMFLAPALGSPTELMLQDTLKSAIVSMCALVAALLLFLQVRKRREPLRWHAVLWLPLMLLAYALGSMAWSHTFLASVESIRWFVFALLVWLGLNVLTRQRLGWLAAGFHAGAVVASVWAVLQFWADLPLFPQGPVPASTFINRNFFAEFVVCTVPFGMLLLAKARRSGTVALLACSNALVVLALFMTGTRAALIALWLQLFLLLPLIAWRCRSQFAFPAWSRNLRAIAIGLFLGLLLGLGMIPTDNAKVLDEERGATALQRAVNRTESIGPKDYSLGVRMVMWRATLNAIRAKPLVGLGAGAWESEIPLYQAEGSQLETDYYVHNEFLQMVAEYGLVGWVFLLGLVTYLLTAAWRSWKAVTPEAREDQPWRAVMLTSLLALMVVSNIGFAWRMAATGALFALCLGGLAASDARQGWRRRWAALPLRWSPMTASVCLGLTGVCLVLALYITQQAATAERKLVQAAKLALTITQSGRPNSPEWDGTKRELLELVREGVAITPHYRKITPMVADELARWGDWKDATWIWESVLSSRPYVVAIISNAARGHASMGEMDQALALLERAKRIQPHAPAVRSLEVIMLARSGQADRAYALAKEAIDQGFYDFDLVNAAVALALQRKDFAMAEKATELRLRDWPQTKARSLVQLGLIHIQQGDLARGAQQVREGLAAAQQPEERDQLLQQVPPSWMPLVTGSAPAAGTQTSANSK
ncbi:hypothetical protein HHL11_31380 [Ramlibacter sp. G-1-2-2]|uniref:O-antigen ligase-related domain-containing protein n=1 Tax=Ramlibacter agri TaxID=2728837 RepID=A0A848HIF5_9BURK|nr:O-antigen ligase family protein [Ramlibacter agri]NML48293.1 hypothetical protein [Ramlibacter agri]